MEIRDFDFGVKPYVTTPPEKNRKLRIHALFRVHMLFCVHAVFRV